MRRIFLVFFLVLGVMTKNYSQSELSDYSYIIIPDKFDFLKSEDQFQLNSLTKFLFNKYGFHAFIESERPDVSRCDGLYANLEGNPGFIYSKITVVIKDCDGQEVFRSEEGRSKEKDYQKAYFESLREGFESIEKLHVSQKEMEILSETSSNRNSKKAETIMPNNVDVVQKPISKSGNNQKPEAKFSTYNLDGKNFLLRQTTDGYSLYEESTSAPDGLELLGTLDVVDSAKIYFNDVTGNIYKASFDAANNLTIHKNGDVFTYKFVHQ